MPRRTGGRLGALLAAHMATGRSRNVGIGAVPNSWLFPGHLPGRPITASYLGQRLGAFGIDARCDYHHGCRLGARRWR